MIQSKQLSRIHKKIVPHTSNSKVKEAIRISTFFRHQVFCTVAGRGRCSVIFGNIWASIKLALAKDL